MKKGFVFLLAMAALLAMSSVATATTVNSIQFGNQIETYNWDVSTLVGKDTKFTTNQPVVAIAEVKSSAAKPSNVSVTWSLEGPGEFLKLGESTKTNWGKPLYFSARFGQLPPGKYQFSVDVFENKKRVAGKEATFSVVAGSLVANFEKLTVGSTLMSGKRNTSAFYFKNKPEADKYLMAVVELRDVAGVNEFDLKVVFDGKKSLTFSALDQKLENYQLNSIRYVIVTIGEDKLAAGKHTADVFIRSGDNDWRRISPKTPLNVTIEK